MCEVISISNQKGGVAKTTTSINLGVALAQKGKRVLLIDFDPQANLTMSLGYPNTDELEHTIRNLMLGQIECMALSNVKEIDYEKYILSAHGIDFIPASIELSEVENILINTMSRENVMKRIVNAIKGNYDYIFIDCQPSLNVLTVNALTSSDGVIIPVQSHYLSAKGLELLLRTISSVKQNLNEKLSIKGVLITMLDGRSSFQKGVIDTVSQAYGEYLNVFDSKIPLSVKVSENQAKGLPIVTEKNNKVASSYISLAEELMQIGCGM